MEADEPVTETSGTVGKKPKKDAGTSKVRCSACGGIGHMKSNREKCPRADGLNVVMTKEQEEEQLTSVIEESGLVRIEGAKITLKRQVD